MVIRNVVLKQHNLECGKKPAQIIDQPFFPEEYTWREVYNEIIRKTDKENINYIFLDEPQQVGAKSKYQIFKIVLQN